MHESIHSILRKSKYETGLISIVDNKSKMLVGEALNEGLTEWVVEKVGLESNGYPVELNIVKQLECVLGENKIVKLLNADCTKNAHKIFNTSVNDVILLLSKVDNILVLDRNIKDYRYIVNGLNECIYNAEKGNQVHEKLMKMSLYKNEIENSEYIEYIRKNRISDSIEERKKYFETRTQECTKDLIKCIRDVNNKIYKDYVQPDIENIKIAKTIEPEKAKTYLKKYDEYFKLSYKGVIRDFEEQNVLRKIYIYNEKINETDDKYNKNILQARKEALEEYYSLRNQLSEIVVNDTIKNIKKGQIKNEVLDENLKLIKDEDGLKAISKTLLPINSKNIEKMCSILKNENPSENIKDARFITLESNGNQKVIYINKNI